MYDKQTSQGVRPAKSHVDIATVAIGALAVLCATALGIGAAVDFKVYYTAALNLRNQGWGAVYDLHGLTPYKYHPITVFVFLPWSLFPFTVAKWLWAIFNGWLIWDIHLRAKRYFAVSAAVVLLGFGFCVHALTWQLKFGNVTLWMLWAVLFVAAQKRVWLRECATSLLILLKATWLLWLGVFLVTGHWRRVFQLSLWLLGFSGIIWICFGGAPFESWWATLGDPTHAHNYPKNDNQSLFGLTYRNRSLVGDVWTWMVGCWVFAALFLWQTWPYRRQESAVFLATAVLWLWCGPLSWIHHQLLLLPVIVACLRGLEWNHWTRDHALLGLVWIALNGTGELFLQRGGFTWAHQAGLPLVGLVTMLWLLPRFYRCPQLSFEHK